MLRAQQAGAAAAVVSSAAANEWVRAMEGGPDGPLVTIPAVMILTADGEALRMLIATGTDVEVGGALLGEKGSGWAGWEERADIKGVGGRGDGVGR